MWLRKDNKCPKYACHHILLKKCQDSIWLFTSTLLMYFQHIYTTLLYLKKNGCLSQLWITKGRPVASKRRTEALTSVKTLKKTPEKTKYRTSLISHQFNIAPVFLFWEYHFYYIIYKPTRCAANFNDWEITKLKQYLRRRQKVRFLESIQLTCKRGDTILNGSQSSLVAIFHRGGWCVLRILFCVCKNVVFLRDPCQFRIQQLEKRNRFWWITSFPKPTVAQW